MDIIKDLKELTDTKDARFVCGVYLIRSIKNSKIYIGKSINIGQRISTHLSKLKSNKHENSVLQNHFNQNGEFYFKYKVLLICRVSELNYNEKRLINKYNSDNNLIGFNCEPDSNSKEIELNIDKEIIEKVCRKIQSIRIAAWFLKIKYSTLKRLISKYDCFNSDFNFYD